MASKQPIPMQWPMPQSDNPQIAVAVVFPHNTNLTNGVGPSIARDIINLYQKYHPMN